MLEVIAGGCRCGAVRYTVDRATLPAAYACHCTDCQTWSGSSFTTQFFMPAEALSVAGVVTDYAFKVGDVPGVVLFLESDSLAAAADIVNGLPVVQRGLLTFELDPLAYVMHM